MRSVLTFLALSLLASACGDDESSRAEVETEPAAEAPSSPARPPSAMGEETGGFRNVGLQLFDPDAVEGPSARLFFDRAPGHSTDGEVMVRFLPAADDARGVNGAATFDATMGMFATARLDRGQLGRFGTIDVVLEATHEGETIRERFRFPVGEGRDDPNSPIYLGERIAAPSAEGQD